MPRFTVRYVGGESGHYEVFVNNTFVFSADTAHEAWHEIELYRSAFRNN